MALMKSNLIEFAYREIQKGVGTGKYTSAHIQDGYIEFRSAGGDWLAEGDAEPGKLENTMLRYARAMQIAADPSAERKEFAKKLYKLVAPEGDSQLALFSQFAAGEIDKEQLKKQWQSIPQRRKAVQVRHRKVQPAVKLWPPQNCSAIIWIHELACKAWAVRERLLLNLLAAKIYSVSLT
jgi:hypothetical protein